MLRTDSRRLACRKESDRGSKHANLIATSAAEMILKVNGSAEGMRSFHISFSFTARSCLQTLFNPGQMAKWQLGEPGAFACQHVSCSSVSASWARSRRERIEKHHYHDRD